MKKKRRWPNDEIRSLELDVEFLDRLLVEMDPDLYDDDAAEEAVRQARKLIEQAKGAVSDKLKRRLA